MPEATSIVYSQYREIERRIKKRGFREERSFERSSDEICFESPEVNGFKVRILTACSLEKREECRGLSLFSDGDVVSGPTEPIMGQVLIIDMRTGVEVYSGVVYRMPNFVENLLKKVWLAWLRVRRPPRCPECNIRMEICRRRVNGQTWWGCRRAMAHSKKEPIGMPWDIMLSGEERAIVREMRKDRAAAKEALTGSARAGTGAEH